MRQWTAKGDVRSLSLETRLWPLYVWLEADSQHAWHYLWPDRSHTRGPGCYDASSDRGKGKRMKNWKER